MNYDANQIGFIFQGKEINPITKEVSKSKGIWSRKCLTIGVDTILNWSPQELLQNEGLIVDDNDKPLSGIQMYNLAAKCKRQGFIVIPMCDNYDERGYCLGHEIEENGECND